MLRLLFSVIVLIAHSSLFCKSVPLTPPQLDKSNILLSKSHCKRGPRGYNGPPGANGIQGSAGAAGMMGATGATGATGTGSFPTANNTLTFIFQTQQDLSKSGFWQAIVIAPDQTQYAGPSINIQSPSTAFTINIGSPILLGPYAIVLYNFGGIAATQSFVTNPITVINHALVPPPNVDIVTKYNSSMILANSGETEEFFYNPFIVIP